MSYPPRPFIVKAIEQCDQIALSFSQYLADLIEHMPNSIKIFAKLGSKFRQIRNNSSQNAKNLFCQSGEISPNLATLPQRYRLKARTKFEKGRHFLQLHNHFICSTIPRLLW